MHEKSSLDKYNLNLGSDTVITQIRAQCQVLYGEMVITYISVYGEN